MALQDRTLQAYWCCRSKVASTQATLAFSGAHNMLPSLTGQRMSLGTNRRAVEHTFCHNDSGFTLVSIFAEAAPRDVCSTWASSSLESSSFGVRRVLNLCSLRRSLLLPAAAAWSVCDPPVLAKRSVLAVRRRDAVGLTNTTVRRSPSGPASESPVRVCRIRSLSSPGLKPPSTGAHPW